MLCGRRLTCRLTADVVPPPQIANSHKSKKQQAQMAAAAASKAQAAADAAAAADVISVTIPSLPEKEITVGGVRHRLAEPLLKGKTPGGDTVWEAVGRAMESSALNGADRVNVWEGLTVVGDMARFKCKLNNRKCQLTSSFPHLCRYVCQPLLAVKLRPALRLAACACEAATHTVSRCQVPCKTFANRTATTSPTTRARRPTWLRSSARRWWPSSHSMTARASTTCPS